MQKFFLCLTDRRGGFNAKSTVLDLVVKALGNKSYAIKGNKAALYQAKQAETVSSHSGALVDFKNKRVITFEELEERPLNSSFLKEVTGGDASITIRAPHAVNSEVMHFKGKIMMAFNESKMPRLDVDDQALLKRMLVVEHRSLFYDGTPPPGPYVFPKDVDIKDRVSGATMLAWMLEGLSRYKRDKFGGLPEQLEQWKRDLVSGQDEVAQWVQEHVIESQNAFFTATDAYQHFTIRGGKVPQRAFKQRLQRMMSQRFCAQKMIAGQNLRSVFSGVALGAGP